MTVFAYGEPVVFTSAVLTADPYSGETIREDWTTPTVQLSTTAGVEPVGSEEPTQEGRQAVIVGFRLYLPGIVDVKPGWRVTVRGDTYRVDGQPAQWRSPFTGWEAGTVVSCGRTDG